MKLIILALIGALICMSAAEAQELTISINGIAFWPERIDAHRGDRITWVNNDGVRHEILFSKNPADSASTHIRYQLSPGESISITVINHGDFDYMCRWHGMLGTVHVD